VTFKTSLTRDCLATCNNTVLSAACRNIDPRLDINCPVRDRLGGAYPLGSSRSRVNEPRVLLMTSGIPGLLSAVWRCRASSDRRYPQNRAYGRARAYRTSPRLPFLNHVLYQHGDSACMYVRACMYAHTRARARAEENIDGRVAAGCARCVRGRGSIIEKCRS